MNPEIVAKLCGGLTLLKFFPSDPAAGKALFKLVGQMASTEDQVKWLVERMLFLFDEWPGPRTLRAVFCRRYKPREGPDLATAVIPQYPDGLPPEQKRLEAQPLPALPPGHKASADPQIEAMVATAAKLMPAMSRGFSGPDDEFAKALREIATPPQDRPLAPLPEVPTNPDAKVTREDIERAVRELRESRKATGGPA